MFTPRARIVAVAAVMIAVTAVFTLLVRIPIPATQGYVNFSDVATYFAAFAFGPVIGFVAGGIGAALADIIGGYAQFAVLTLLAHGLQGVVAGILGRGRSLPGLIVAWAAGPAIAEAPFNLLQNVAGGLVGIPLYLAVRRAYPPVMRLARPEGWQEG